MSYIWIYTYIPHHTNDVYNQSCMTTKYQQRRQRTFPWNSCKCHDCFFYQYHMHVRFFLNVILLIIFNVPCTPVCRDCGAETALCVQIYTPDHNLASLSPVLLWKFCIKIIVDWREVVIFSEKLKFWKGILIVMQRTMGDKHAGDKIRYNTSEFLLNIML